MNNNDNRFSKDKMLPYLYFIRAVLSQMQVWCDDGDKLIKKREMEKGEQIANYEKANEESNSKILDYKKSIDINNGIIKDKKAEISLMELRIKANENNANKGKRYASGKDVSRNYDYRDFQNFFLEKKSIIIVLSGIIGIILGIVLYMSPNWKSVDTVGSLNNFATFIAGIILGLLIGAGIFVLLVFVLPLIIYPLYMLSTKEKHKSNGRKIAKEAKKKAPKLVEESNEVIKRNQEKILEIEKYNEGFEKLISLCNSDINNKLALINKVNNNHDMYVIGVNENIANLCTPLHNDALQIVGDMLDERDWEKVDILIYLFETGRADNKKEALNLADTGEFRANITNSLSIINNTLRSGFNRLNTAIDSSASMLRQTFKQQIGSLTETIVSNAKETNRRIEDLSKETDGLKSSFNSWSSKMADDYKSSTNSILEKIDKSNCEIGITNAMLKNVEKTSQQLYRETMKHIKKENSPNKQSVL